MVKLLTWALAACLLSGLAGCGRSGDERDARRTAEELYRAVAAKHGARACATLTAAAAQALEQEEKAACAQAITSVDLKGGRAARTQVFGTGAAVTFADGTLAYLDQTGAGWRVSAAGCEPRGERPAKCELED
jgi:hypothetical protein